MTNLKAKTENMKYVFGPVPSRRLGRSLGVDLIPFKTCTFDCVYCQLGRTTHHAVERREYVPMDQILTQLQTALAGGPKPDYITLAGSGEPTLYSRLGELIDRIHGLTDVPVDVITNGSTLWIDEVFEDIVKADLIIPSLDAGDEKTYMAINRSVIEITFQKLLAGLTWLRQSCPEKVWLEVFLIKGVNDDPDHVKKIADLAREMKFARVQLNTAVRPPAEKSVRCVTPAELESLANLFTPRAEIIADFPAPSGEGGSRVSAEAVLELIRRHPCTLDDVVAGLNTQRDEVRKMVEVLVKENKIQSQFQQNKEYYIYRE